MFGFLKRKKAAPVISAVIAAGGSSTRMGGENKLLAELGGLPVLARTLAAFENNGNISEIILVAKEDMLFTYTDIAKAFGITKLSQVVSGGATRAESVYNGVCAASPESTHVLVHDGARPLVSPQVIQGVIDETVRVGCAAAAVKVNDTVRVYDEEKGRYVLADRDKMRAMQTPQGADRQLLAAALKHCIDNGIQVTDDCAALEELGAKPALTEGSYKNIKITTKEDLIIAEGFLEAEI